MGYELGNKISTDMASIKADALSLIAIAPASSAATANDGAHQPVSFAQSMKDAVHSVDDKQRVASEKMSEVDSGRTDDLVGAMLASQEASLSFSMLMQVRNKVMGAVDDLIKLPL
ncbi:flagellar hook-basal body complex protein FliE [Noviherbaspirillum cavernae]|uniref:Flagellar hook-basal body complex protein FliE n=2 Tax=Noviherbaspirillum cavernae TaxID=2320862 RepID=A0A418WVM8_9BURK|nr:flagellar hook-basal body complex protein FliE [Noviherbaspirillum cavernae]